MRKILLLALATTTFTILATPLAHAQTPTQVSENPGPWNEPCVRLDVMGGTLYHQGLCAGKGLLYPTLLGAPLDCVVWINNSVLGIPVLSFFCV